MALTNPKIFGLNVKSELSDIKNKNIALQNLGINPLDLEIIKGSKNAGMERYDWFSFSRLKTPIYKTLSRFLGESTILSNILDQRAGTDRTLFGNLDVNGSISGSAIRYRFLKDNDPGKLADISTSRVSAWSSSDPRANNQVLSTQNKARISYGARVGIIPNGQLRFGTQSTDTVPLGNDSSNTSPQNDFLGPGAEGQTRIQTTLVPEQREFPSEVPTSKIKCKIADSNGQLQDVYLYAMKGIPLIFKGFFRNLNAKVNLNYSAGGSIAASWKIVETGNANKFTNFREEGTGESAIRFRSPVSRERFIKFYYNPIHITSIQIQSANIRELPSVKLSECTSLDFAYNSLVLFPNISFIAPKLITLSLMRNPFYLSDNEFERKFNNIIVDKLKTNSGAGGDSSIQNLNMEGTFYGSIQRHLISSKLPNLRSLNFSRGRGAYFHPDDRTNDSSDPNFISDNKGQDCFCPDIPDGVTSYNIANNDFRNVDLRATQSGSVAVVNTDPSDGSLSIGTTTLPRGSYSFKKAENLTELNVSGNYNLNDSKSPSTFTLESINSLVNVNYSVTGLSIADFSSGSSTLKKYSQTYAYNGRNNPLVTNTKYLFESCISLEKLSFYATNLGEINFPTTFTNPNLTDLDLRYTSIKGGVQGVADASQNEVISNQTFSNCSEIRNIYIDSPNLLPLEINSDAFKQNPNLNYLWLRSNNNVKGNIPDFGGNPKLTSLFLENNNFDGLLPNFGSNPLINYVNLRNNNFSGQIPEYTNLSNLRFLYLNNNNLTSIGEPGNLPQLREYYAYNNQLSGEIPDFSGARANLRYLSLYNNKLSAYKIGSFKKLYKIRFIDLSNNNLDQTSQDNILFDLFDNWNTIKRGGVTINLRGNTNNGNVNEVPSDESKEKALTLVQNGWNISVNGGLS